MPVNAFIHFIVYLYIMLRNVKIGKILGVKSLPILTQVGPNRGKFRKILPNFLKLYMISAKYTGFLLESARVLTES